MSATLWQIELSPYSEKARWALDFKRLPHGVRTPMPGWHQVAALGLTGGHWRRLPVLVLDGAVVPDSSAIIAALEDHTPDPPLYPEDSAERERALELERFFDEEMAPEVRRLGWSLMLEDPTLVADALFGERHPVQARIVRSSGPLARLVMRVDYGVNDAAVARARTKVTEAMDRIEAELGDGDYLVGDRFSVADLAGAALLTPLLAPPERPYLPPRLPDAAQAIRDELTARRAGQWVFETYARHRSARVE